MYKKMPKIIENSIELIILLVLQRHSLNELAQRRSDTNKRNKFIPLKKTHEITDLSLIIQKKRLN